MAEKTAEKATNTREPEVIEQSTEDFEQEFGLEGNDVEALEGAEPDEEAILKQTDRLIALEGEGDNLARLDKIAEMDEAEDDEGGEEDEEDEKEAGLEAEGAEDEEDESGEGDEAEEDEEEDEDGEDGESDEDKAEDDDRSPLESTVAGLKPEGAQALLDELFRQHGGELVVPYKSNGEEKHATIEQLRERAAGYDGQEEVNRRAAQVRAAREEIEEDREALKDIAGRLRQSQEALQRYFTEAPEDLIDDVILPNASPEFMVQLRDSLDKKIMRIEDDPMGFEADRKVSRMERQLGQLMHLLANGGGGGVAPNGGKGGGEPTQPNTGEIPEDFGFQPGVGYPKEFSLLAGRSLKKSARAVGIPYSEVVDAWNDGGRQEDPFDVLKEMVGSRFAEVDKVERLKKAGSKPRPKHKSGGAPKPPKRNEAARQTSWDDIEGEVAREVSKIEF